MADRRIAFCFNPDTLVPHHEDPTPPKIFHSGITSKQLRELTGCVRKSDPKEFWHNRGSLNVWVGEVVHFVLRDNGATVPTSVGRVIDSIVEKPVADVSPDDLKGTLAEIAMRETDMTFPDFFRKAYGNQDKAMVIRVH